MLEISRWRVLAAQHRDGIKSFLVALIIRLSSNETSFTEHNTLLKRLNLSLVQVCLHFDARLCQFENCADCVHSPPSAFSCLVLLQILKQDWPHNWPNFVTDLVTASKQNPILCTNNMHILKLLRCAAVVFQLH